MKTMEKVLGYFWELLMRTGAPFAILLGRVVRMGDGSGNESEMVSLAVWSIILGAVVWILGVLLSVWLWKHTFITLR